MKILSELPLDGKPQHRIGGKDLCDLFDLSPAGLADLKKRGIAIHCGHDSYDLTATTQAYVVHLRGEASGRGTGEQAVSLTNERTRLAKEQADAAAIKNAKMRGDLVDALNKKNFSISVENTGGKMNRGKIEGGQFKSEKKTGYHGGIYIQY
ncbi:MAG TPA: hypothetical protein EYP19_05490, partial [Desulfobacterales bacterium]|nr:hypothetical protein [Desulfobacterales bacterium]